MESSYASIGGDVTDTGFGASAVVGLTMHAGKLVVCGGFWEIGGAAVNHIAGYDGSAWSAFPGFGTYENVHKCYSFDGKLYAVRAAGQCYVWKGSSWTHMQASFTWVVLVP